MPKFDSLSKSNLNKNGQTGFYGDSTRKRIMYPAIVVPNGTQDSSEQGRIRARIVSVDDENGEIIGKQNNNQENYNSYSGVDRGIRDGDLVMCVPFLPQFFFVKPQPGEMVYVVMETPVDESSTRFWIGPIINSKLKLNYQSFEESIKIFDKTTFTGNKKINSSEITVQNVFPKDSDVAIQGRNDADLMLKNKEALLIAGKFNKQTYSVNTETPSFLKLKQVPSSVDELNTVSPPPATHNIVISLIESTQTFTSKIEVIHIKENLLMESEEDQTTNRGDSISFLNTKIKEYKKKYEKWNFISSNIPEFSTFPTSFFKKDNTVQTVGENITLSNYSHAELTSTLLTLYSKRGKFRNNEIKGFEKSDDLTSFGNLADSLHPSVFGDELIRVLDLIIRYLLNHIHQPQNPPLPTSISDEIKKYTIEGELQRLISNHVRIN